MRQITAKRSAALLLATLSAALLLCGCVESDEKSTEDGPVEITFETTAPAPQVSEQTTQAPEETAEAVLSLPAVPEHILIGSGVVARDYIRRTGNNGRYHKDYNHEILKLCYEF